MRQKAPYVTDAVPIGYAESAPVRPDTVFVSLLNELIDRTGGPTQDAVDDAATAAAAAQAAANAAALAALAAQNAAGTAQTTANTALAQASGVSLSISRSAVSIFSYANGTTPSFADATGQATVFSGSTDVTSMATVSVSAVNCTGEINTSAGVPVAGQPKGFYRVTALSADTGTLTISGTYNGTTQSRAFSVSRVRTGFEIVGTLPSTDLFEGRIVFLTTDDKLYRYTGTAWTTAVPAADISGQVGGSQIATNAITADKIEAGAITAAKIGANQVTANKLESDLVLASTIRTASSGYRTEISNSGDFPIWYGTGTKNATNGLFYVKTDGTVFFKGTVGSGSVLQVFRITAASADGNASGMAASGSVSGTGSVTLENGTSPYTYAWTHVSTTDQNTPTISSTTSSAPTFTSTVSDDGLGNNFSRSIWQVIVTDNLGNVAVRNAIVTLMWTDTR